jgi:hypothetical protein
MVPLSYVPRKSTLLLLFDEAAWRLVDNSEGTGRLSEARLVAATEELNRIADEIREASTRASTRDDAALRASDWSQQPSIPTTTEVPSAQSSIHETAPPI